MDFKALCRELREEPKKVRYWDSELKKHDLIDPKQVGNRHDYSESDFEIFKRLKLIMDDGAGTVGEGIRMLKQDLTPAEAMEKYQQSQRQIEVLQKKLVQLRKPFWSRLAEWFKKLFSEVLFPRTE